jgi:hypothetical protein
VKAVILAALTLAWGCSLDRNALLPDVSTVDSGSDGSAECPDGFVDLDGRPGCECAISAEACNGADDDCDRMIDEEIATPESCGNGFDDDCDLSIDEDCACSPLGGTQPCGDDTGECQPGTQTCVATGWGACEGAVGPSAETCNGLDDDCDGTVDGITRECSTDVGICSAGFEMCAGGAYGPCSGVSPGVERCDAARLDENCDGTSNEGCTCDEGETESCGSCRTRTCNASGSWGACMSTMTAETCNGVDDNCDGTTDEGTTCGMCTQVNNGTRSYLFCFDITRTWSQARAYCMMFGYDLVTVEDSTENNWLNSQERSLFENNYLWWYGGSDAATEDTWRWIPTGMDVTYTDWDGGEPSGGTSDNCLNNENRSNPEWNADDCSMSLRFVCEDQDS